MALFTGGRSFFGEEDEHEEALYGTANQRVAVGCAGSDHGGAEVFDRVPVTHPPDAGLARLEANASPALADRLADAAPSETRGCSECRLASDASLVAAPGTQAALRCFGNRLFHHEPVEQRRTSGDHAAADECERIRPGPIDDKAGDHR